MKLCRTIDDMWEYFKQKLLTGMTKFIPRSKHSSKNSKKKFQPFNLEFKKLFIKNADSGSDEFQLRIRQYLTNIKKVCKRETVKLTQQE